MKKMVKYILVIGCGLLLFSACNLLSSPVTPEERLAEFQDNLNSDSRTSSYTHVHSGVAEYTNIKTSNWWDTRLPTTYRPYSFSVAFSGESSGVKTYTGQVIYSGLSHVIIISFKEEVSGDGVWMIYSITIDGNPLF